MNPATDATFHTSFYKKFNPNHNPPFYDVCVRRIPINHLKTHLAKDAEKGGSKLVEQFAQGVWGGWGFAIQREYMAYKYKNDTTTAHQLWTKPELKSSNYEVGTELTDHFQVLERRDSNTILFRCGDSPLKNPGEARPGDGLFEMSAKADMENGFAEFRLKSVFYQGEGTTDKAPFHGEWFMPFAHRQYAKLWMENAVHNCRPGLWDYIDYEAIRWHGFDGKS